MILEMVRAAQASPEIMGFVGSAPGLVTLLALRVALEGRSLPVVHGCGWDSGAATPESAAAHWLPASPRVTRSALVCASQLACWRSQHTLGGLCLPAQL